MADCRISEVIVEKAFTELTGDMDKRAVITELAKSLVTARRIKAGDVDGLVTMLAEGEFESKLASANYLAQMGAVKAVKPLENLSNKYDRHDTEKVFSRAVEIINNRAVAERDDKQAGTKTTNTGETAQDETRSSVLAMNRARPELDVISTGLIAESKEIVDGNPIKAGGTSIAEVVPASLYQNLVLYYSFYTNYCEYLGYYTP